MATSGSDKVSREEDLEDSDDLERDQNEDIEDFI